MKFSSISLIAVALAAIVGSAIAAPCPLDARESVDLFKRQPHDHRADHLRAATALQLTAHANSATARAAELTSQGPTKQYTQTDWQRASLIHNLMAQTEQSRIRLHQQLAAHPHETDLHGLARSDTQVAEHNRGVAERIHRLAVADRRTH